VSAPAAVLAVTTVPPMMAYVRCFRVTAHPESKLAVHATATKRWLNLFTASAYQPARGTQPAGARRA
jgi:hypothetical protein